MQMETTTHLVAPHGQHHRPATDVQADHPQAAARGGAALRPTGAGIMTLKVRRLSDEMFAVEVTTARGHLFIDHNCRLKSDWLQSARSDLFVSFLSIRLQASEIVHLRQLPIGQSVTLEMLP
jgi:hypothetical protein